MTVWIEPKQKEFEFEYTDEHIKQQMEYQIGSPVGENFSTYN